MSGAVVNVLEVNRVRHVDLDGITAAVAAAVAASDELGLEPVRELLRALRQLRVQPLPEHLTSTTAGVGIELEASRHELEQLADEFERSAIVSNVPAAAAWRLAADRLRELAPLR